MGITSSQAQADAVANPNGTSIGYAENSALPLGAYSTFHGQTVDNTSVLLAYTRTGDANLDGVVDNNDVTIVGANYAPGIPKAAWALGDFDYNGFVDNDDVTLLGVFYNPGAPPLIAPAPAGGSDVAAVPEPAGVALLLSGVAAFVICVFWRSRSRQAGRANHRMNVAIVLAGIRSHRFSAPGTERLSGHKG
jgi:hypothetical protein